MPIYRSLIAASLGLAAMNARAAPLLELLNTVPAPPKDVPTALSWMKDGQIVAPEYTRFKQALEAERAAIAALNGGSYPVPGTAPPAVTADVPEIQAAARAYSDYLMLNTGARDPAVLLQKRTSWVQGAMGGQQASNTRKMKPCPVPCQDPALAAHNQPFLDKKSRLADEEVQMWSAMFPDWRKGRVNAVSAADVRLSAAGYGTAAKTPEGRAAIAAYRAAILKEVELQLSITELEVTRAAAIESSKSGILPDGLSGASKTKAK